MSRTAQEIVEVEVFAPADQIIQLISGAQVMYPPELRKLQGQAMELGTPVDDYEEAATQEGWRQHADNDEFYTDTGKSVHADDWEQLCARESIDPYQCEILQFWIVSPWLAEQLERRNERVDRDFAGLCIWGRQTVGQAIYADGVMQHIEQSIATADSRRGE